MLEFKRVSIHTNTSKDKDNQLTKEVAQNLVNNGFIVVLDEVYTGLIESDKIKYVPFYDLFKSSDIAIILGGDGTILKVCSKVALAGIPILGVNLGHLGFLDELEKDELDILPEVLKSATTVTSRMMMDVNVTFASTGISKTFYTLNDAVLSCSVTTKMIDVELFSGSNKAIQCYADGIIVATPTGSTAYSLAAGGPIIDPSTELLCVTPICPHSLMSKPIVFDANSTLNIAGKVRSSRGQLTLTIDGKKPILLEPDDKVSITKSKLEFKMLKVHESRFFDVVNYKMYNN